MHPLGRISQGSRNTIFTLLLSLTVIIMLVMNTVGKSLNTDEAPLGIVSFEFAGSTQKAQKILDSWDNAAQLRAAFIQGLDFLYLVIYSTTIAIACLWAGQILHKARWPFASLGILLAWGLWLAAILDAVENIALVIIMLRRIITPLPEIAAVCATIKFALIFLGLVYALYALAIRLTLSLKPRD